MRFQFETPAFKNSIWKLEKSVIAEWIDQRINQQNYADALKDGERIASDKYFRGREKIDLHVRSKIIVLHKMFLVERRYTSVYKQ